MSTEYAARMEVLQRKREELTAQRQAIEKRMALREATAAEFSAVALQSCRHKWKAQRSAAVAAKKRNDEFVRSLQDAQRQVHESWRRLQSDPAGSGAVLAQEKARYNRRVEQIYPAWQEQLQRQRVQKLRELEDKKRAVERRRYLAKKSFEKEQTLDDLIRKTRHEVEMAENLEQNEQYERELLRTQSSNQAKEVDQSIREVALEARTYLQQQATKNREVASELDEELAEKLSETFSPRHTLRALREGSRSLAFEGNQQYDDEEKPMRQIRVEIPARMNTPTRSYYPGIDQHSSNQTYRADEIYEDDYDDEILQESDPRHANLDRTPTDAAAAGNARTFFKQNMSTRQSAVATRDEPPQATSHTLVSREYRPAKAELYVRVEPQQPARSEIREEVIRLEVLPTLVNGRLDPIPETNEPISSAGASSATMFDATDLHHDEFKRHECTSAGTSGPITTFIAVKPHTDERKSPSSAPPTKIEEGRDASSPAAPSNGLSKLDTSLVGQVHVSQGIEFNNNVAENLSGDAIVDKPPTTGVQEAKTSFVPASSTIKNAALTITDGPAERPHEQPHAEATSEEAPSPMDDKSDILSSEDSLIPSYQEQAGVTSNINIPDEVKSVSSPLDPKDILKEMDGEAAQFKSSMDIEVVPMKTETVDAQEFENRLIHDGESKLESFQGAHSTVDSIKANSLAAGKPVETPLIKPVPSIDEMTSIEREPSINEKATTEVSGTSSAPISFNTDLLEPLSPPAVNSQLTEDGMLLTSMQSDDFDISSSNTQQIAETTMSDTPSQEDTIVPAAVAHSVESGAKPLDTPIPVADDTSTVSVTEKLSPVDRVKALGALISRVEEGATEGDTLGGLSDTGSSSESKRELIKMAVGGRKAQIAFFGSDICFELILDISRDLGPVLFPPKAFEGIMNDQKIRKLHQSNKEKQLDLWKALSAHLKQLVQLKAIPPSTLVDLFVAAFLAHDLDNQRSQRKLREFLQTVCGGGGSKTSSPRKETSAASPPPSPPKQEQRTPSPDPAKPAEAEERVGTPQLLQTAFLQRQSPPKAKVFGIASSGFKDRSSGPADVLMSMSSGPMKLSQKLMRGGKMNDYSEFEEEEEVDLQNLIGSKALGRPQQAARTSPAGRSAAKQAAEQDDDEFDF